MTTGPAVEAAGPPWTLIVPVLEITLPAEPVVEVGWPPPEPVRGGPVAAAGLAAGPGRCVAA